MESWGGHEGGDWEFSDLSAQPQISINKKNVEHSH